MKSEIYHCLDCKSIVKLSKEKYGRIVVGKCKNCGGSNLMKEL